MSGKSRPEKLSSARLGRAKIKEFLKEVNNGAIGKDRMTQKKLKEGEILDGYQAYHIGYP